MRKAGPRKAGRPGSGPRRPHIGCREPIRDEPPERLLLSPSDPSFQDRWSRRGPLNGRHPKANRSRWRWILPLAIKGVSTH